jgi:glycosyltransferase involved in cell wall biosynthesis
MSHSTPHDHDQASGPLGQKVTDAYELSVVLPCRDEGSTVAGCVRQAQIGMRNLGVHGEVVVVDNGSRDDSAALARDAGARVIEVQQRGYGAALRAGISSAQGTFVFVADSDGSYDLANLGAFWTRLLDGDDLVIGNRFDGGIAAEAMPYWHRHVGNPLLSWCGRTLFPTAVRDFHCGLRGFRRAAIVRLPLRANGMEFATELIVRAVNAGLVVSEVPTPLVKAGRIGRSHLRPIRDGLRHLRLLIAVSFASKLARRRHLWGSERRGATRM